MTELEKLIKLKEIDAITERLLHRGSITLDEGNRVLKILNRDLKITNDSTPLNWVAVTLLQLTRKVIENEKE